MGHIRMERTDFTISTSGFVVVVLVVVVFKCSVLLF